MELEDSFIENWKYIIKSCNKQNKEKPTLLENEALILQSVKEMFDFEQINNPTKDLEYLYAENEAQV